MKRETNVVGGGPARQNDRRLVRHLDGWHDVGNRARHGIELRRGGDGNARDAVHTVDAVDAVRVGIRVVPGLWGEEVLRQVLGPVVLCGCHLALDNGSHRLWRVGVVLGGVPSHGRARERLNGSEAVVTHPPVRGGHVRKMSPRIEPRLRRCRRRPLDRRNVFPPRQVLQWVGRSLGGSVDGVVRFGSVHDMMSGCESEVVSVESVSICRVRLLNRMARTEHGEEECVVLPTCWADSEFRKFKLREGEDKLHLCSLRCW